MNKAAAVVQASPIVKLMAAAGSFGTALADIQQGEVDSAAAADSLPTVLNADTCESNQTDRETGFWNLI